MYEGKDPDQMTKATLRIENCIETHSRFREILVVEGEAEPSNMGGNSAIRCLSLRILQKDIRRVTGGQIGMVR